MFKLEFLPFNEGGVFTSFDYKKLKFFAIMIINTQAAGMDS